MKTLLRLRSVLLALSVVSTLCASAPAEKNRWSITPDGGIAWDINLKPLQDENPGGSSRRVTLHDHIEMSGRKLSMIVFYELDKAGKFRIERQVIWPMLRFKPNTTRHHWSLFFREDVMPRIVVGNDPAQFETTTRVTHKGIMRLEGTYQRNRALGFQRVLFPSVDKPAVIDRTILTNKSNADIVLEIEPKETVARTDAERGIYGAYVATTRVLGTGKRTLKPGESTEFSVVISAGKEGEALPEIDVAAEEKARADRVASFWDKLQLETPDRVLNTAFAFAKIRAAESIYETKGGLFHSPGGGHYYAANWANDQAEYANPYFAMFGDQTAIESALNTWRQFGKYMNPEYKPIPSSIISEGAGFWHGARDRGDMAMIAYGASRFALAYGRKDTAEQIWPLIEWSLEYSKRKTTADGVIASDSDELENRFPAGVANLCTSALHYDALLSAAALVRELGKPEAQAEAYLAEAKALRGAIDRYFGRNVEGFETYRYFDKTVPAVIPSALTRHAHYKDKPDLLRAWICIPLTVDIYERKEGTIAALFSPRLWTADGLATEAGREDFWDRSTLYALRGVFAAGATEAALEKLTYYSNRRLLGEHVPYPVEAYPENDQRHLSAESALYCRIYTEGVFGIRPTGFKRFNLTPRLPKDWPAMALKKVHAFGGVFDLSVKREGSKLRVDVTREGGAPISQLIEPGATTSISL